MGGAPNDPLVGSTTNLGGRIILSGGGSIQPSGRTPPKGAQLTGPQKTPKKATRGCPWFQCRWHFYPRTQDHWLIPARCM